MRGCRRAGSAAPAGAGLDLDQHLRLRTLSPGATSTSLTTPAAEEGTSIVALSDSRVAMASSTADSVADLHEQLDHRHAEKSPMSGTTTSTTPPPVGAGAAGRGGVQGRRGQRWPEPAAARGGRRRGGGAGASTLISTVPSATLSPRPTSTSLTTPAAGRHVHRGLVGFQRRDGVITLMVSPDLDEQFDHRNLRRNR